MSRSLIQEIRLGASAERVYHALTDAAEFCSFTGGCAAEIEKKVGGLFSLFDGKISGINLEMVSDKRLVQAWRAGNWAEGIFSIARFELDSNGTETILKFEHVGFPAGEKEHLESGWQKMYWQPLQSFLQ